MRRSIKLSSLVLGAVVSGVGVENCLVELVLRGGLVYHSPDSSLGGDSVYYDKKIGVERDYRGAGFEHDKEFMWV